MTKSWSCTQSSQLIRAQLLIMPEKSMTMLTGTKDNKCGFELSK